MTTPINTVTWWELPTADLERAQAFYGAVFGWTFAPFGEGYVGIHRDGELIGGLFHQADGASAGPPAIRVYVNVADLEAVLARVPTAGGAVTVPRSAIGGDLGWWAEITSPDGEWLGLCTATPAAT